MPRRPDRRTAARFTVEPMYSSVSVVVTGATRGGAKAPATDSQPSEGHVYEVGLGGMRFELDEPLPSRTAVDLTITLRGCEAPIAVRGRVVDVFDAADDPGPRRMVVEFETFKDGAEATLERYLSQKWLKPAADQRASRPNASASAAASTSGRTSSAKVKSASAA